MLGAEVLGPAMFRVLVLLSWDLLDLKSSDLLVEIESLTDISDGSPDLS